MKAKKIQIEKAAHLSLAKQFKDDLKVFSCCTDISDGYMSTTWSLDPLDAPFIETEIVWDTVIETQSDAKPKFYLYVLDAR